jgi:hypothetical protein
MAYASGASLPEVRDLLRHSTLAMVSRYAHSNPERLRALVDGLSMSGSVPGSVPGERQKTAASAPNPEASEQFAGDAKVDSAQKIG